MKREALNLFAVLVFLAMTVATPLAAQQEFFSAGNEAYQRGDYQSALEDYNRLLNAGLRSADLYFNIGNTHFKMGDLGKSILFFERARQLDSGADDIETNLRLARSLTADEITALPQFWLIRLTSWTVHLIPRGTLRLATGLLYILTLAALTAVTLGKAVMPMRRLALALGVVTVLLTANLVVIEFGLGRTTEAIVMTPEAPVYSAPSEDPDLHVFNVHEGTLVRVDQESGEWYEVVLADGKVGWLKADATETI